MANSEYADQLIERLSLLEAQGRFLNNISQAHSRSIVQRFNVDKSLWPSYKFRDRDLIFAAHFMLRNALQLKDDLNTSQIAEHYIFRASEILEFIYACNPKKDYQSIRQLFNAALGYYISGHYARAYVLVKDLGNALPPELELLKSLFLKDVVGLRSLINS